MANPTTFNGWQMPTASDLVTDLPADFDVFGQAVDNSLWNSGYGQAGKNKIINGNFGIWQRGTSFSNPANEAYTADRFNITYDGTAATRTISQQAFTAGTAPVAGYESQYFYRYARTVAGSGATFDIIRQPIEDVRTFAGQTVNVSFWAKSDSGTPIITVALQQVFGSGGSTAVRTDIGTATLSTSWTRYSVTATLPSISGKTLGANNYVNLQLRTPINTVQTFDFWGVQVEYGSKATPFQTASGSIQGELAMCQRYYETNLNPGVFFATFTSASAYVQGVNLAAASTGSLGGTIYFKVTKRSAPTINIKSAYSATANKVSRFSDAIDIGTTVTAGWIGQNNFSSINDSGSGFTANTQYYFTYEAVSEL